MADISIQNLTKYYGDRLILKDISFDVQPGEKVAILGSNGAGKTTLLNIITGRLSYDNGNVSLGLGKSIGIIDQMPDFSTDMKVEDVLRLAFVESDRAMQEMQAITLQMEDSPSDESLLKRYSMLESRLEALGGYNHDFEIDRVANGLEISKEMRGQAFCSLSGGEKTRINLARIILENTDILLLDEPTNHLDMDAVNWLGGYLEHYKGTVLTISHDRYFLDQCCNRIIEIRDGCCDFYAGSYSFYAAQKERRYEEQLKHHEHEMAEKKRLEETARRMHQHGTELLAKRAASIEKRIARMKVTDRPRQMRRMSISFGDPNYETEEVLKVQDIQKSFGSKRVLNNISFQIQNREKIAILGANGTGKTTLLKIILGEEKPDDGVVRNGIGLKPAYLPQQVHFENPHRNLIDTLIYDKNVSMQIARSRLGAFQFSGETQMKTIQMLSGGEKSRLRLCELMYDPLNLLILDEPTNHLDLLSREWIEEAVESFDGTLLFVSHDRYFVERFATRILYLENGKLIDFVGSYSEFLNFREKNKEQDVDILQNVQRNSNKKEDPKPKRTGGTKQLQKQLNVLEREISQLEKEIAELDEKMTEVSSDSVKLMEFVQEKEGQELLLASKMEEWEMVSLELDGLQ